MKKFLVILMVCFVGVGCDNPQTSGGNETSIDGDYTIKVIDGCQYIEYDYGILDQRVYSLTHKGDCNNPIHKSKWTATIDSVTGEISVPYNHK